MRQKFSWEHALALMVMVCLVFVVAGAVLAQEEPGSEAAIPLFELTDAGDTHTTVPFNSVNTISNGPANLASNDVTTVLTPTYSWHTITGKGRVTYDFELYNSSDVVISAGLTLTIAPGATPMSSQMGLTVTQHNRP